MSQILKLSKTNMLIKLDELQFEYFKSWLVFRKNDLLEIYYDKEIFINQLFISSVDILNSTKSSPSSRENIASMFNLIYSSTWINFLKKFELYDTINHNDLATSLLLTWIRESFFKEKSFKPYWTNDYLNLSKKLSSPINETDNLLTENYNGIILQSSMVKKKNIFKINEQQKYFQLSKSTVVNKLKKDVTLPKNISRTIKVQLLLTPYQREIIDGWINTSRYVYNKTVNAINYNEEKINFNNLRTLFVTDKTKTTHPKYVRYTDEKKTYFEKIKNVKNDLVNFNKLDKDKKNLLKKIENCKTEKTKIKFNEELNKISQNLIKYDAYKINDYEQALIIFNTHNELEKLNVSNLLNDNTLFKYLIYVLDQKILKTKEKITNLEKEIKGIKNTNVEEWELATPKDIRAGAVQDVCTAFDGCFTRLNRGQIRHFNMRLKKKNDPKKSIVMPKNLLKIIDKNTIRFAPKYLEKESNIKIKKIKKLKKNREDFYKNFKIDHDCRLIKNHNNYYLFIPMSKPIVTTKHAVNYCGVDPGVRTFMTVFGNNGVDEYQHETDKLKKINNKINMLRGERKYNSKEILENKIKKLNEKINDENTYLESKKKLTERLNNYKMKLNDSKIKFSKRKYRKKTINKYDVKKSNLINELHWKTINDILKNNDLIFYGDIKSHDIVKDGKNHVLNKNTNDLKFYEFKKRLLEKAEEKNKLVYEINEAFTTKTCSSCGFINNLVGSSEVYKCVNNNCKIHVGRDINAAKNILMKGLIENQIC
jgi:transposase